ncbi:MAG: 4-hydroxyphenylpyruvate dioxygenase, partial [Myxococcota bacterium]
MTDLFENPVGLDGFDFVEFSAPDKGVLEPVFESMGFHRVAHHRSKDVELWRQGGINVITNYEPRSAAWYFSREHGPSACGMGFRVRDARKAYEYLLARGAEPIQPQTGPMELCIPGIRGIGNSIIYLIDRYDRGEGELSIYDIDFEYLPDVDRYPEGCGFKHIDHLTHNVYRGRMAYWAKFYEDLFNFR